MVLDVLKYDGVMIFHNTIAEQNTCKQGTSGQAGAMTHFALHDNFTVHIKCRHSDCRPSGHLTPETDLLLLSEPLRLPYQV